MKRAIGIAVIMVLCSNLSIAQESIGFTDSKDIQTLLEYRLPDWGYSNFIMNFNARNSGQSNQFGEFSINDHSSDFRLIPEYTLFRESESRLLEFNTALNLNYSAGTSDIEVQNGDIEQDNDLLRTNLNSSIVLKKYVGTNRFIHAENNVALNYSSDKFENRQGGALQDETVRYDRTFILNPRLGYGFGRIRNVGPIIRAIRLNERLGAINNTGLDNGDLQQAADQFTRFRGYQRNYDRPEKYFWRDLDRDISSDLGSLDAFDLLYLTDVLDEAIGTRLEGWEVIGGLQFEYLNQLQRTESTPGTLNRSTNTDKELGAFVTARWFKNTSLKQQWGLFLNSELNYPLGEQDDPGPFSIDRNVVLNGGVSWLWTVTDRVLIQSSLSDSYSRTRYEADDSASDVYENYSGWENRLALNAGVNLFIENSLQLNISANPFLIHAGTTDNEHILNFRSLRWQLAAGLRYYFSRNLY